MVKVLNLKSLLVVVAMMLFVACGDSSSSTAVCDPGCALGTVCVEGTCEVIDCTNQGCPDEGLVCVQNPTGEPEKVCTALECNANKPCAAGEVCQSGFCVDGGAECSTCGTSDDCVNGLVCAQVGPSLNCTKSCSQSSECNSGWTCAPSSNGVGSTCIPEVNQCTGCLVDGCEDGQTCNPSTGMCTTPVAQCGNCVNDGQCGEGFRCYGKADGTKFCVPECADGSCPANGTCVDAGNGIGVCEWTSVGPCCLGENCGGPTDPCDSMECSAPTAICLNGVCVACAQDSDCPGDQVCNASLECEDGQQQCTGETPWFNAALNKCCECLNSSHCGGGTCLTTTCLCEGSNPTGNICDTCADPYPGCAEFQGQWVCVQCSEDSQCPTNECDLTSYTCKGGGAAPAQGNCGTNGCAPELSCDEASGLCYDPEGNCDNITSFCPNGGECVDFLSQLTGGLPGVVAVAVCRCRAANCRAIARVQVLGIVPKV